MPSSFHVVGVDLSGPTNVADTALAGLRVDARGPTLQVTDIGVGDAALRDCVAGLPAPVFVGLDAPLSYQPGGGQRRRDAALRRVAVEAGLKAGTVMAPTMTRMAYLTLRGVTVARLLGSLSPAPRITEVHPGTALALRGAPPASVTAMKSSAVHRRRLRAWLAAKGVEGLPDGDLSDHLLAALGAALGTLDWARGHAAWIQDAEPPHHPFDLIA